MVSIQVFSHPSWTTVIQMRTTVTTSMPVETLPSDLGRTSSAGSSNRRLYLMWEHQPPNRSPSSMPFWIK